MYCKSSRLTALAEQKDIVRQDRSIQSTREDAALCRARRDESSFLLDRLKVDDDLLFVDVIGIVRTAVPVDCCFAFFPLLGGDFIEEVVLAWDAAVIFRWAPSFTAKKLRIRCLLLRRLTFSTIIRCSQLSPKSLAV